MDEQDKITGCYARVSTGKQDMGGQEEELAKYCRDNGLQCKLYADVGLSGGFGKNRPAYDKLMRDAASGTIKRVLVTKLDRFGRSVQQLVSAMQQLQSYGVEFCSLRDAFDTSTPAGRLQFNILCSFSEFERDIIRERMSWGRARAEAQGSKSGKPCHRPRKELPRKETLEMLGWHASERAIATRFGMSRQTASKRIKELQAREGLKTA
jgi:DNA invertase Pin-like site-specific DNA recombinase